MHDGGGDRSQTVAALNQLIPRLRSRGFSFVTLATIAGLSRATHRSERFELAADAARPVFGVQRAPGFLLVELLQWIVLACRRAGGARACSACLPWPRTTPAQPGASRADAGYLPSVSVVVPAYNEAVGIERAGPLAGRQRLPRARGDRGRRRLDRRHRGDRRPRSRLRGCG